MEPISYNDGVAYRGEVSRPGVHPARMWPRRSGYAPYSSSALEAARRRTQDLYNARRSQLGLQSGPPPPPPALLPPSPPPTAHHNMIWSGASGKPHTGSYVIGPRHLDETEQSYYRPSGPPSLAGGESSMSFPPQTTQTHTIVVEAAVEPNQPNTPDVPGGKSRQPFPTILLPPARRSCLIASACVLITLCQPAGLIWGLITKKSYDYLAM